MSCLQYSLTRHRTSRLSAIEGICASSEGLVTAGPVAVGHDDDDVMMAFPPVREECQRNECAELRDENAQLRIEISRLQVALEKRFCIDSLKSDAAVKFHTGIVGLKTFIILWAWLEPGHGWSLQHRALFCFHQQRVSQIRRLKVLVLITAIPPVKQWEQVEKFVCKMNFLSFC